jgi:cytochrome c553
MKIQVWACLAIVAAGCTPKAAPPPEPSFGGVMAEIGRRFETTGAAIAAGRYALARYEVGEIEESFADELPHASLPKEGHPEVLGPQRVAFAAPGGPLARLGQALVAQPVDGQATDAQKRALADAFSEAAGACNGCHRASGHGFLDVPATPGRRVPNTDPLP